MSNEMPRAGEDELPEADAGLTAQGAPGGGRCDVSRRRAARSQQAPPLILARCQRIKVVASENV
ncbi:hypothetical protein [Streptomyces sp. NPDC050388]|uniref:hypothetical protein n=1 Tax=Streptomyces sp. NPDC050388 TaxID=3155781 RepID=UPI0034145E49